MAAAKPDITVRHITEQHNRLLESITEENGCRVACPGCGTTFLVHPSQKEGLCFSCMETVSVSAAMRNALAEKVRPGIGTYAALARLAEDKLAAGYYTAAEKIFRELAAVNEEDGSAWRGLLAARTRNYTNLEKKPPEGIYSRALAYSSGTQAQQMQEKWRLYTRAYTQKQEQLERIRRQQEEQKRRVREEEERTRAQQQRTEEVQQKARGKENAGGIARIVLRVLLVTGGIFLVIALLASGAGFFGIMLLFSLFGSFGRNNNNNNNNNRRRR